MKFSELIKRANLEPLEMHILKDPDIKGVFHNSRDVGEGGLFFAIKGQKFDGHEFIGDAVKRGAVAAVVSRPIEQEIDHIIVSSVRYALSALSNAFYGEPSRRLKIVGITGTNGKTTTSFFVHSILKKAGMSPGLIGTIEYDLIKRRIKARRTTPEADELHGMLNEILKAGGKSAVMEVSSHGLDEYRVEHIDFDVGVLTNLSRDHLDYHGTMENYRKAKARLFMLSRSAAINSDDPSSDYFLEVAGGRRVLTYGVDSGELQARIIESSIEFTRISFHGALDMEVELRIPGVFNVYNALAAASSAVLLGIDADAIKDGLESLARVPGRFEVIKGPFFHVVIDYAHTPDALEKLLSAVRSLIKNGCVITVFGAGGDRDRGKRPLMARAVEKYSDVAIVTSDNPRHEDPMKIIDDVVSGFENLTPRYDPDRRAAIEFALSIAKPGDIIVIAGKGHEDYQIVGDEVLPFSDREVVLDILADMDGGAQ